MVNRPLETSKQMYKPEKQPDRSLFFFQDMETREKTGAQLLRNYKLMIGILTIKDTPTITTHIMDIDNFGTVDPIEYLQRQRLLNFLKIMSYRSTLSVFMMDVTVVVLCFNPNDILIKYLDIKIICKGFYKDGIRHTTGTKHLIF